MIPDTMISTNKNIPVIGVVILFLLQVYLTADVFGMSEFIKYVLPFILLMASLSVFWVYRSSIISSQSVSDNKNTYEWSNKGWVGAVLGILSLALCYEELRKLFVMYPEPVKYSDVIPQLEALYDRFAKGEFPYYPVALGTHAPYPVYLPLNWLPVGIGRGLGIDTRWVGVGLLLIPFAVYGWYIFKKNVITWLKVVLVFLPSIVLWSRILPHTIHMPVTLETLIAAYYMLLAVGLVSRNLPMIVIGIILCFLSRYTLVFWFPLFAYLLWTNVPKKTSFIVWGSLLVSSIIVLAPFFATHPDALLEGLEYHNNCAIAEMNGYGNPPISWTHETGLYFAPHFKVLLGGSADHKTLLLRAVQALIMISLNVIGILGYRKLKGKVDIYKYSLGYLYLFMLFFYMFSPLTYRYYFIPLLMMSTVLVADACINLYRKRAN